jgi:phosphate transport system substrate-binding protein
LLRLRSLPRRYSLPGSHALRTSAWSAQDPRIAAANPNLDLPDLQIAVILRSDASGATFVFTKHLSAVSQAFAKQIGSGMTVQWPNNGNMLATPLSDGVAATIKQIPGAIGYVEYGYAKLSNMDSARLQNKAGNYVAAGDKAGAPTLATAVLDSHLRGWIEDPAGADAYPIAASTWLLAYKKQDPKKAEWIRKLVEYCVTTGQSISESMGYIPLPENVVAKIKTAAAQIQ